jgi:hypothetical protein
MKIRVIADVTLGDDELHAGQDAIVSDDDGQALIALGAATPLPEGELGGFAVPMPTVAGD